MTIYDHHDHGRFQAKFYPRGRQMVVLVTVFINRLNNLFNKN